MSGRPSITLSDVAKRAGVSTATVSLALRNSTKIQELTKERIRTIAAELGYTPDPSLAKLMSHLRLRRNSGITGTIIGLCFCNDDSVHMKRYQEAAVRRAGELGYRFSMELIPHSDEGLERHRQSIWNRGVEGLLFLPSRVPMAAQDLYPWEHYCVVSASANPQTPECNRVLVNWHNGIRRIREQLGERGFRRLGFVLNTSLDHLFKYLLSSAVGERLCAAEPGLVQPLFYLPSRGDLASPHVNPSFRTLVTEALHPTTRQALEPMETALVPWYRRSKPDVLVFDSEDSASAGITQLRKSGVMLCPSCVLSRSPGSFYAGMEMPHETVASTAIDVLGQMIQRGLRGIPEAPFEQLYRGKWIDGPSLLRPA